jgi:hypothetical protein
MARPCAAALLLLLAGPLLAAPDDGVARLVVNEREVALGRVLEGAVVERRVTLTNAGDAPLLVKHVEVACGCTVARAPDAPIAPGGSAELVLRFDSRGRRGPQRLAVWLHTNDPTQADRGRGCTALALVGVVDTLFALTPEGAFLGEVLRGEGPHAATVTIVADPSVAARFAPRLAADAALPDGLEVALEREPGAARLTVRLAADAPAGELHHELALETGVAEQPRVTVPVVAIVSPRVAGPRAVELFDVRRAAGAQRRVTLERRDGGAGLDIAEVVVPLTFLRARVEPVSDVRVDLVIDLLPEAPPGPFATVLEVHLDDPREPLLRLPVVGEVLPRVTVDPPVVLLAPGEERVVLVRGGRPREVRAKGAGLSARLEEPAPGERARARVVVRAGADWDGAPGFLVLETDVEGEERLALPVRRAP